MANEAILLQKGIYNARQYTCADGVSISKGTILRLTGKNTASGSVVSGCAFAGVMAMDKIANDGSTTCSAYVDGIYDCKISGPGCSIGDILMISMANILTLANIANVMSGALVGKALETGSADEVIAVAIGSFA